VKALRKPFDFILFSNLFVSLCAAAMAMQTYLIISAEINTAYIAFTFFSTLFLYNLQRVVLSPMYTKASASERHVWIVGNKKTLTLFYTLSAVGMAMCVFLIGTRLLFIMVPLGIISVFYFLPGVRLRQLPAIKALMVSMVWAVVSVYTPLLLEEKAQINIELLCMFSERTLFVLSLCIVFNIRDIAHDKASEVRTIPSLYGIKTGKGAAIICIALSLLFTMILYRLGVYSMLNTIAIAISLLITVIGIVQCSEKSSEYFYLFGIDGMMLLQMLLVCSFHFF
jgi:4-hydroxybenzoate polyprenyltransferase